MRHTILLTLLCLALTPSSAQLPDSLIQLWEYAIPTDVGTYQKTKSYLLQAVSKDSSLNNAQQLLDLTKNTQSKKNKGDALILNAIVALRKGDATSAIQYGEKALTFEASLSQFSLIDLYDTLAKSYSRQQNYPPRIGYLNKLIELYKTQKNYHALAGAYNELGGTYWGLSIYPSALDAYYQCTVQLYWKF